RIVASHLELNEDEIVRQGTEFFINALDSEINVQISSKAERRIQYLLGAYSKTENSIQELEGGLAKTHSRIDINSIVQDSERVFERAISSRSLDEILLHYNRKSLHNRVSGIFELANGGYEKLFIRLLKGDKQGEILQALERYLPTIE